MKFGLFYEHQLPKPWTENSEYDLLQQSLAQIELADPDILVCLGGPSSQTLLGFTDGIRKTRGRFIAYNTGKREIRALATFHPAYLLRSPLEKRLAWRDFLAIKQALKAN